MKTNTLAHLERISYGIPMKKRIIEHNIPLDDVRPPQCIEMGGEIVGDKLVFTPPKDVPLPFIVRDNEIILGDYTIRVHLQSIDAVVPTAA